MTSCKNNHQDEKKFRFNKICDDAGRRRKLTWEEWLKNTYNKESVREFSKRRKEAHNIIILKKKKYI